MSNIQFNFNGIPPGVASQATAGGTLIGGAFCALKGANSFGLAVGSKADLKAAGSKNSTVQSFFNKLIGSPSSSYSQRARHLVESAIWGFAATVFLRVGLESLGFQTRMNQSALNPQFDKTDFVHVKPGTANEETNEATDLTDAWCSSVSECFYNSVGWLNDHTSDLYSRGGSALGFGITAAKEYTWDQTPDYGLGASDRLFSGALALKNYTVSGFNWVDDNLQNYPSWALAGIKSQSFASTAVLGAEVVASYKKGKAMGGTRGLVGAGFGALKGLANLCVNGAKGLVSFGQSGVSKAGAAFQSWVAEPMNGAYLATVGGISAITYERLPKNIKAKIDALLTKMYKSRLPIPGKDLKLAEITSRVSSSTGQSISNLLQTFRGQESALGKAADAAHALITSKSDSSATDVAAAMMKAYKGASVGAEVGTRLFTFKTVVGFMEAAGAAVGFSYVKDWVFVGEKSEEVK